MDSHKIRNILEEIPSGDESLLEESDSDEGEDVGLELCGGLDQIVQNVNSDHEDELESNDSSSSRDRPRPTRPRHGPILIEPDSDIDDSELGSEVGLESDVESEVESDDDLPLAVRVNRQGIVWQKSSRPVHLHPFCEDSGPCIDDSVETPVDVFLCLFPDDLLQHIVFQTNLYANQEYLKTGKPFTPTNAQEIKFFLAINILMGLKPLPSYKDYWSNHTELRDSYITSLMSRNRFSWLLSHLHLNDNSLQPQRGEDGFDKLYKVRPFLEKLSSTYKSCYKPSRNQSIDESMIKFKGRSSLRQYMPNKPIKRGYKVWVRADESGFVCEFQLYTGKVNDATEKRLGARVIKDLTSSLHGKWHHVCFDNFFASVDIMAFLQEKRMYACCTVRKSSRGIAKDLIDDNKLKRGDMDWRATTTGLLTLKWKDKKGILFLSNYHNPNNLTTVNRKNKNGETEAIPCPTLVRDYNAMMGFVDKADQLKSYYEIDRKSKKWWLRIFWHFVDVSIDNAFIIFKERSEGKVMTLKMFRCAVVTGLVGAGAATISPRNRKSLKDNQHYKKHVPLERRLDKAAHMPVRGTSRRCAHCSTKAKPHRSRWGCTICKVALCASLTKNCFASYHGTEV